MLPYPAATQIAAPTIIARNRLASGKHRAKVRSAKHIESNGQSAVSQDNSQIVIPRPRPIGTQSGSLSRSSSSQYSIFANCICKRWRSAQGKFKLPGVPSIPNVIQDSVLPYHAEFWYAFVTRNWTAAFSTEIAQKNRPVRLDVSDK